MLAAPGITLMAMILTAWSGPSQAEDLSPHDQAIQKQYPCKSVRYDFNSASDLRDFVVQAGHFEVRDGSLVGSINSTQVNKTAHIAHKMDLMYGTIITRLKAPAVDGVCTALVTRDPLTTDGADEIDIEIMGKSKNKFQTNVFSKGIIEYGTFGGEHTVPGGFDKFHTYTIDWKPDAVKWYIDDELVRTYRRDSPESYSKAKNFHNWIEGPGHVAFGPWAPMLTAQDTVDWIGAPPDFSKFPNGRIDAEMDSLEIVCMGDSSANVPPASDSDDDDAPAPGSEDAYSPDDELDNGSLPSSRASLALSLALTLAVLSFAT